MKEDKNAKTTWLFRPMQEDDRAEVLAMMRTFYDSAALLSSPPDEVLVRNVDACTGGSPYAEGLIIEESLCEEAAAGKDAAVAGYSMLAKSYSTEYGGPCIWIEDLYLKEPYRGRGAGSALLAFVKEKHPEAVIIRLEVEMENTPAIAAYRKAGYAVMEYTEMYRLKEDCDSSGL